MTIREKVIQDAVTGKLTGTPFVPSEAQILREIKDRSENRMSFIDIPIRSDMTSDSALLTRQMQEVEDRLQAFYQQEEQLNDRINRLDETERQELDALSREAQVVEDQIADRESSASFTAEWTPTIGEHFRDLSTIDMAQTTASVYTQEGLVQLPTADRSLAETGWSENDTGTVSIIHGKDLVSGVSVSRGSRLRNLTDGSPTVWTLDIVALKQGTVAIDIAIPVLATGNTKDKWVYLNRLDLTVGTPLKADILVVDDQGTATTVAENEDIMNQGRWSFPGQRVSSFHIVAYVTLLGAGRHNVTLRELGLHLDRYRSHASVKSVSRTHETQGNESVLGPVSIDVDEVLPQGTDIDYWVGLDPLVSGSFVDIMGRVVDPGLSAVKFDINASGTQPTSTLRDWSHLQGASGYQGWEPDWMGIRPVNRSGVTKNPQVVSFGHLRHHINASGFAGSQPNNSDWDPIAYKSTEAGWWRPMVGSGEAVPEASTALPDLTTHNTDYYFIYYWPEEHAPLEDSIRINAGTVVNEDGVIVSSGALWSAAQDSSPELVDETVTHLEPNVSGVITHTASGNILFDTVRGLRFRDSQDEPFIRGHEYFVYGSGNLLELDVGIIGSEQSAFGQQTRQYEITYTEELPEGRTPTYVYSAVVQTAPQENRPKVIIKNTTALHDIRIISMGNAWKLDNIEFIERPGDQSIIERGLEPGYTRIMLTSTVDNFDTAKNIEFVGDVGSFEVPFWLKVVSPETLLYQVPRYDHSKCALLPQVSGAQFLVVNDPGSEESREFGTARMGQAFKDDPRHIFHDGASGLPSYFNITWDEVVRPETRLLFRADLSTQHPDITPTLKSVRINTSAHVEIPDLETVAEIEIDDLRGIV